MHQNQLIFPLQDQWSNQKDKTVCRLIRKYGQSKTDYQKLVTKQPKLMAQY